MKRVLVIALSVIMLLGGTLSAQAATRATVKCPNGTCNQYISGGTYTGPCRICSQKVYRYTCGRCGAVFSVCESSHYQ